MIKKKAKTAPTPTATPAAEKEVAAPVASETKKRELEEYANEKGDGGRVGEGENVVGGGEAKKAKLDEDA